MKRKKSFIWGLLALVSAALACNLGNPVNPGQEATAQVLATRFAGTATAAGGSNMDDENVKNAEARATERIQAAEATQAIQAAQGAAAQEATAAAFAPFSGELPQYSVDPGAGRPGWIHPPVTLEINGKNQFDYANQFMSTVAGDFAISADITWNTQYGGSGCGFAIRSDGNQEALNQYLVVATRGANGHVYFATMADGEVVTGQDIYAYGLDPAFSWKNDTTNRLTVVAQGNSFAIYSNGTHLGNFDPTTPPPQPSIPPPPPEPVDKSDPAAMAAYTAAKAEHEITVNQIRAQYNTRLQRYQQADKVFPKGFLALVAVSESGRTTCHFENAWLWLID